MRFFETQQRAFPLRLWFVFVALATGIGLLVYVLGGIALPLGVAVSMLLAATAARSAWQKASPGARSRVIQRARAGVIAGVCATIVYDLGRYGLISLVPLRFWPFDIFRVFGGLLVGADAPPLLLSAAGFIYHYANGIGFALAYLFFIKRPTIWTGLLWAALLEGMMLSVYPSWLNIQALYSEFVAVSVWGHILYGLTLGGLGRYVLLKGGGNDE